MFSISSFFSLLPIIHQNYFFSLSIYFIIPISACFFPLFLFFALVGDIFVQVSFFQNSPFTNCSFCFPLSHIFLSLSVRSFFFLYILKAAYIIHSPNLISPFFYLFRYQYFFFIPSAIIKLSCIHFFILFSFPSFLLTDFILQKYSLNQVFLLLCVINFHSFYIMSSILTCFFSSSLFLR